MAAAAAIDRAAARKDDDDDDEEEKGLGTMLLRLWLLITVEELKPVM